MTKKRKIILAVTVLISITVLSAWIAAYNDLKDGLSARGVFVLEDERIELTHSGETNSVIGVSEPCFDAEYLSDDEKT